MGPTVSHHAVAELLAAFALDAVDPDDARLVERHLAECPRCREEVATHQRTAALLANVGGTAPAGLWEAIAAKIGPPETANIEPQPSPSSPSGRERPRRSIGVRAGALVAAAALVAIAVLGIEIARGGNGSTIPPAAQAALRDPRAQRILLATTARQPSVVAEIAVEPAGTAYLFNRHLRPLAESSTYQLWAVIDGRPVSAALLGAKPATVAFKVASPDRTAAYAITVEPAGGSVAPTRAPVATSTA